MTALAARQGHHWLIILDWWDKGASVVAVVKRRRDVASKVHERRRVATAHRDEGL